MLLKRNTLRKKEYTLLLHTLGVYIYIYILILNDRFLNVSLTDKVPSDLFSPFLKSEIKDQ